MVDTGNIKYEKNGIIVDSNKNIWLNGTNIKEGLDHKMSTRVTKTYPSKARKHKIVGEQKKQLIQVSLREVKKIQVITVCGATAAHKLAVSLFGLSHKTIHEIQSKLLKKC